MTHTKEFKNLIHDSTAALAKIVAEEQAHEKDLLDTKTRQKKIQHELEEDIKQRTQKMHDGLQACILSLRQCTDLPISADALVQELHTCFQKIDSAKTLSKFGQGVLQGTSWKTSLGISNDCMQTLYRGAPALFERKEYVNAEKAFFVVCSLDPTQSGYWIGLGHSSFQMHNYPQAINAYSMASALDPQNVWPHIWAANTFEKENDFVYAKMALEEALALLQSQKPKNQELIQELQARIQIKH